MPGFIACSAGAFVPADVCTMSLNEFPPALLALELALLSPQASAIRAHCDLIVIVCSAACDLLVTFPLYRRRGGEEVLRSRCLPISEGWIDEPINI